MSELAEYFSAFIPHHSSYDILNLLQKLLINEEGTILVMKIFFGGKESWASVSMLVVFMQKTLSGKEARGRKGV